MEKSKKILIVDDEPNIREVVRFALEKAGFATIEATDGKQAVETFASQAPDLIVLDIMMPEMDGTDVCRTIRKTSDVPILFLSSKDEELDRIIGLELGGDDYITKPFSPRELVARIKAVFRRIDAVRNVPEPTVEETATVLHYGNLRLDTDRFQAFWQETEVVLTPTEFGLLRTLLGYPGKVFSRDELMDGAYNFHNVVTDRTIDSHIRRVRRKFSDAGGDPIETVHGVGYKLGDCGRQGA